MEWEQVSTELLNKSVALARVGPYWLLT